MTEDEEGGLSRSDLIAGLLSDPVTRGLAMPDSKAEPLTSVDGEERLSGEELDEALDRAVDRSERTSLIQLRERYSYALGGFLAFQLVFMNVVLVLVGCHVLNLSAGTIQFYLGGTLGEIFGLVSVATHFLFSDKEFLGGRRARMRGTPPPQYPWSLTQLARLLD